MTGKLLSFQDISKLIDSMPRVPRVPERELRCHPSVAESLRQLTRGGEYALHDEMTGLLGIRVYEKASYVTGAWELYEDGACTAHGNIYGGRWDCELDVPPFEFRRSAPQ